MNQSEYMMHNRIHNNDANKAASEKQGVTQSALGFVPSMSTVKMMFDKH